MQPPDRSALPYNVQVYLSAIDTKRTFELQENEEKVAIAGAVQMALLEKLTEEDKEALVTYIVHQREYMTRVHTT